MIKTATFLLFFAFLFTFSQAKPVVFQPQEFRSFEINNTQAAVNTPLNRRITLREVAELIKIYKRAVLNPRSCSYRVSIRTSCSSPTYTRDQISLAFGDAYGNQVYAPRLDDPSPITFERCSSDTFEIHGPCAYQICYVYLYRNGYDGWKPETVTIYGSSTKSVTFHFDTYIPNGIWFGFNHCSGALASSTSTVLQEQS